MGWNDLIGMRLDQYEILDELGRGGSSRVYHAYDTEGERDVAIKVIPNDADDRALFTSRFAREVAAVQKLHHPNIVKVFGAGENDEFVYLVMQCVTGGTLRRQLSGPLPVPVAVAYMVQIAYALHHAHERGIIHRDVKPSNMLLEYPGSNHLLLTDFGIAKIQGARGLTKSGTTIGTPEYMSPEQAEGRDIDERSDIYALGCVLYETLAGRPPFLGSTPVSVLFQHVHSRPAYIRGFNPGVPGELVQILEIALAKRPDERFGTAESFARALRPFAGEMPEMNLQQPETGPIVISRSNGLTPSRPLPPRKQIRENDIADRDTILNPAAAARGGMQEEETAPLPAISVRKTAPPYHRHHHTMPPSFARKSAPPGRTRKTMPPAHRARHTQPPGRWRRTMPPFVRVRRTSALSELNLTLGTPESDVQPPIRRGAAAPLVTPRQPAQGGDPISLSLGPRTLRGAVASPTGPNGGDRATRGPNSHPGAFETQTSDTRIPATQPRSRRPRTRIAGIVAAAIVLLLFGWLALNASGLGIGLGGKPQATASNTNGQTVSPTLQATVTPAPTNTAGPQPTATLTQQQILNQRAYGSFRAVTLASFSDGACSGANARSSFNSGQTIYANLCTSGNAVSATMTVAIRQGGQVVYTMAYGINISRSASYFYYTSHVLNAGTYDVLVTLNINGTTAVARDLPLYIK